MNELIQLFQSAEGAPTIIIIIANLTASLLLGLVISFIYQKNHHGLSYSQSLAFTLVILTVLIAVAMMVIGGNLARAFGLLGAFSVIRFRTAIKDPKDISSIFSALVIGMAIGTGNYIIALLATVFLAIVIHVMTNVNFGSMRKFEYISSFTIDLEKTSNEIYEDTFKKYLKNSALLNVHMLRGGKKFEFTYNVRFIDTSKTMDFIKDLGTIAGISDVSVLSSKDHIEY